MNLISVTPTISTTAYAAGDALGGKLIFDGTAHGYGFVQSVTLVDKDAEKAPIDLVLFNQDFTPTADNAVFTVASGEKDRVMAVIPIRTYYDLGTGLAFGVADALSLPFRNAVDFSRVYGQLVIRAAHTYTATSDLVVTLGVLNPGDM